VISVRWRVIFVAAQYGTYIMFPPCLLV